jgi:high-affinity iron transporter
MLATFVIGLREGLEAALIVGIVAAFLRQRGEHEAMRSVWIGVGTALAICLTVGIVLQVISQNLPQREQEGLETVIGAVAVVMVTYMVVWMRRHSRDLKGRLEGVAGTALARGSAGALIAMAFLAVLREGLETAVFLLAAFQASGNGLAAGLGALLGILAAVLLGYGIYRGGVRINMSKFFRTTGLVLVVVAAGLVMTALHTAHEASWLNIGQDHLFDMSAVVRNGSVQASLITGVLGFQPTPTVIEVIGWAVYLVPVGLYVAWPPQKRVPWRPIAWVSAALSVTAAAVATGFAVAAPAKPSAANQPAWQAAVSGTSTSRATAAGFGPSQVTTVRGSATWSSSGATAAGTDQRGGIDVTVLNRVHTAAAITGDRTLPANVTLDQLRSLAGGRLPIGLRPADVSGLIPLGYSEQITDRLWRDTKAGVLLDASRRTVITATAQLPTGPFVIGNVRETVELPTAAARLAAVHVDEGQREIASRAQSWGSDYPTLLTVTAVAFALVALGSVMARRRARRKHHLLRVSFPKLWLARTTCTEDRCRLPPLPGAPAASSGGHLASAQPAPVACWLSPRWQAAEAAAPARRRGPAPPPREA